MTRIYRRIESKECFVCGSKTTDSSKSIKGTTCDLWKHDSKGNVVCNSCHRKDWYHENCEYQLFYAKITQPRRSRLQYDRRNLRSGKWIP